MKEGGGASAAGPKSKLILFSIILGTFMASLDSTIVAVALPTMAAEFSTSGSTTNVSWILLGYTLALCCFILLWGKMGTNYGYRKMFLTGTVIFTVMSFTIGLAGTMDLGGLNTIIVMRVVQGMGAGMITSMGLAMVSSYLPGSRGRAVGAITLAASAGTAFGPVLGGLLCNFHWSYIFFINVPIGILALLISTYSMRGVTEIRGEKQRLDIVGVLLMVIMMFTLIYYLNSANDNGWFSDISLALIVTAFVMAGLLIWWEQRTEEPLISVRLMSIRDVVGTNLVSLLLFMAMAGSYLLLPYYLELVLGYSTLEMGLILVANSVGMMLVGPTVGKISDKTGINSGMVSIGCLISAAGFLMMNRFGADTGLPFIIVALLLMGMGMGIGLVASTNLSMRYADPGEEGQLFSIINTFRQAGSSAGVAILESVFAAGIVLPLVIPDGLVHAFRPAFFVACLFCLAAFVVSRFTKDKEYRESSSSE